VWKTARWRAVVRTPSGVIVARAHRDDITVASRFID